MCIPNVDILPFPRSVCGTHTCKLEWQNIKLNIRLYKTLSTEVNHIYMYIMYEQLLQADNSKFQQRCWKRNIGIIMHPFKSVACRFAFSILANIQTSVRCVCTVHCVFQKLFQTQIRKLIQSNFFLEINFARFCQTHKYMPILSQISTVRFVYKVHAAKKNTKGELNF